MEFRITTHAGYGAPVDAIESLWPCLQQLSLADAGFARGRDEIKATWRHDDARRASREELMEPERRALLEVVCEVCERTSALELDWYAISAVD